MLSNKKKKRSSQKFFRRSSQKNVFQKIFQPLHKILTIQKILLSSSRRQANFRGLEASRPRTSKCVLEDVLEAKDVLEDSTFVKYDVLLQHCCDLRSRVVNTFAFQPSHPGSIRAWVTNAWNGSIYGVGQSVSVSLFKYQYTQRKIHIWNIQLHVNRVRHKGRPQKSEALTESWRDHERAKHTQEHRHSRQERERKCTKQSFFA